MIRLFLVFAFAVCWLVMFSGASEADIQKCMDTTNYNEAQCINELAR